MRTGKATGNKAIALVNGDHWNGSENDENFRGWVVKYNTDKNNFNLSIINLLIVLLIGALGGAIYDLFRLMIGLI